MARKCSCARFSSPGLIICATDPYTLLRRRARLYAPVLSPGLDSHNPQLSLFSAMLRVEGELNVDSYAKYAAAEEDTGPRSWTGQWLKIGLRKAQIFRGQRGPLMEWRDNVRRLRVLGEAGTERKISRIKESASRKLVDLLVRDRSIGAVKVSGLRAVSSDPLRRHFSE